MREQAVQVFLLAIVLALGAILALTTRHVPVGVVASSWAIWGVALGVAGCNVLRVRDRG